MTMETTKKYEDLTLRDSFMFGKVFSNPKNRKLFLDALLQIDLQEEMGETEKHLQEYKDTKYVKLDLFSKEKSKKIYNAEMQNKSTNTNRQKELPRRSRYYQSLIDTAYHKSGESYLKLPETFIIFICTFDPFGYKLPMYTFDTKCNELEEIEYDDGAHKIMFNTTAELSNLPLSCKNMLQYINTGITCDEATETLDKEVKEARKKHEWREEYMKTLTYLDDAYVEGYESRQEEIDNLNAKVEEKDEALAEKDKEIESLKRRLQELKQQ